MPYNNSMSDRKRKIKALVPVYVRGLYNGKYTLREASESTGYSVTWLCILKKRYAKEGASVFEHKNKGRVSPRRLPSAFRQRIASLYAAEYSDVNFTYYKHCLSEFEGLNVSLSTIRNILAEYGQRSPESRKIKKRKPVHRPRVRRECEGDMLQVDGTPYAWFYLSGDNKRYCLTGAIDDATGKITGLYFTENECLYGYLEILRQTCKSFGVPREIYSDRAAVFCHTPRGKKLAQWEKLEVMHEKRTQWQRILEELHINQILAWSPESKGRVERMWRTLQGQLPVWLKKNGITNVEDANKKIGGYIQFFNSTYSVAPAVDDSFFLDPPENLDEILCAQFPRRTDRHGCLSFQGTQFYTPERDLLCVDVTVCISERGIFARHKNVYYPLVPVDNRVQQTKGDSLPQVVVNIIYRYLYAYAKEISA